MVSGGYAEYLAELVESGEFPMEKLDRAVMRVLKIKNELGLFEDPYRGASKEKIEKVCFTAEHRALAKKAALESAVLLKNEGALPLKGRACLIGHMAKKLRYQGVGSSHINAYKLVNPTDCIDWPQADGYIEEGNTNQGLIDEALRLARSVDTPVILAGLTDKFEAEGFDREHMHMPEGMNRLIEAVAAENKNTVVVLMCGSPVELPWADKVNAILYMALPGEAGGEAIKSLLTGEANPCGKLAETWPLSYDDVVTKSIYGEKDAEYREGIFVGYRYYDSANVPVRFKFGHGLSYTSFEYSGLELNGDTLTVSVKNTGDVAGAEVVQLFVEPPEGGLFRPVRELKGFEKVFLKPNEEKKLSFSLSDRSFAVWHDGKWRVPEGTYRLCVGELCVEFTPDNAEKIEAPEWQAGSWYETLDGEPDESDWEKLLGYKYESREKTLGEFDMDSSIMEMMPCSKTMAKLNRIIELVMARSNGGSVDYSNPEFKMMMLSAADSAIRNISISTGISEKIIEALVRRANRGK